MRRQRHSTAGFTLIELLIALAVLILIAALVLPSLGSVSDSTKFRSACDQLSSAVSVCRAEARRTGKAVAVGVRKGEDGRQALVSTGVEQSGAENSQPSTSTGNVLMYLPSGFSVGTADAASDSTEVTDKVMDNAVASTTLPVDGDATAADSATKNLIIFWAGGGATVNAPIIVRGPGGRQAGAKVNSWTGALSIQDTDDAAAEPTPGQTGTDDIGDSGP